MTPHRALCRDTVEDIEGLTHRGRIILPDVIRPDGTASPDQVAIVPPGVVLIKALLPHRELSGPPTGRLGAAIVGTREPDLTPYLTGFGDAVTGDDRRPHISRPQSRDDILKWLYDITGLRYAPAALWRVAGWEIGWLANWLDRLFTGGAMAELIVAERQAAAAVRAAWLVYKASIKTGPLHIRTGVLLAARGVVDMLAAFERIVADALHDTIVHSQRSNIAKVEAAIAQRLRSFIRAIEEAATGPASKIKSALDHGRALVDVIGLFTVVDEPISDRVVRITQALPTKGREPPALDGTFANVLADASMRLERLIAAGPALETPDRWCSEMTGDLSRLTIADPQARLFMLARVRTDLVYKLIVTRRLDRVFEALPWMLAPSAAFPLVFGGPVGAAATLYEVARHREIALELKNRTLDSANGPRLDTHRGKREFSAPAKVLRALKFGTRAGFWLANSTLSHHMVKAFLAGSVFDAAHPLPTLELGRLGWRFEQSMRDPATMQTVINTELGKSIYASTGYHRDLALYMGLDITDLLGNMLIDTFPGELRGPAFNIFVKNADDRRVTLKIGENPFSANEAGAANRDLLLSILMSLDTPTDGVDADWRSDKVVDANTSDLEVARFKGRHTGHNGKRNSDGGSVRRRAASIRKARKDPGRYLRRMVDRARSWTVDSDDRALGRVLSGRLILSKMPPVAQTGIPAIWFRPAIDTPIHDWIADGAPKWQPLALSNIVQAGLIAREVQAVTTAMPKLFGMAISTALRRRVLVPLWTGLAGITEDHAHFSGKASD